MAPVTESPMSTLSFQGTPNTIYTESVEDSRCDTATTVETPARRQDACDPFYSIQRVQGQREPTRMSAMAPPFRPRGLNFYPIPQHQIASAPVTQQPLPGTTEYLLDQIQSQTDSETPFGITSFGEFTNTTVRQRCMKITAMNGGNTLDLVDRALIPLALQGSRRVASAGTAVLLRLGNIYDAALVYSALQGTGELAIEFVSPVVFQIVVSPENASRASAYEGQILLRAPYAANPMLDKDVFAKQVFDLLTNDGDLCAYRKVPDENDFVLIAEFADVSHAGNAIVRLDGKTFGINGIQIKLSHNRPDVAQHGPRPAALSPTPNRQQNADTELATAMKSVFMGRNPAMESVDNVVSRPQPVTQQSQPVTQNVVRGANTTRAAHQQVFYSGSNSQQASPQTFAPQQQQYMMQPNAVAQPQVPLYPVAMGMGMTYYTPPPGMPFTPQLLYYPAQPMNTQMIGMQPFSPGYGRGGRVAEQSPFAPGRGSGPSRQFASRPPNRNRQQQNGHNTVVLQKIREGTDVRTTVMLRNIPNKMNSAELKEIIDSTSFGRYDFSYLRIDFSNGCNVGYAFINFVDPMGIIDFYRARAGRTWPSFRSDKVAEISYATIQGRDCLIQKFRNSSVMCEDPSNRPKLWRTYADSTTDVGEEDIFPEADNPSKLRRSCENAEHIGLFAPAAGQTVRDEQRRRRSQFDRGTTMAEQENDLNYDFDAEYDPELGFPFNE